MPPVYVPAVLFDCFDASGHQVKPSADMDAHLMRLGPLTAHLTYNSLETLVDRMP